MQICNLIRCWGMLAKCHQFCCVWTTQSFFELQVNLPSKSSLELKKVCSVIQDRGNILTYMYVCNTFRHSEYACMWNVYLFSNGGNKCASYASTPSLLTQCMTFVLWACVRNGVVCFHQYCPYLEKVTSLERIQEIVIEKKMQKKILSEEERKKRPLSFASIMNKSR